MTERTFYRPQSTLAVHVKAKEIGTVRTSRSILVLGDGDGIAIHWRPVNSLQRFCKSQHAMIMSSPMTNSDPKISLL